MYNSLVAFEAEKVLVDVQQELQTKIERRVELDREIWALRQVISGLIQVTEKGGKKCPYYWPWNIDQGRLTPACKTVIRAAERALSPMEIRQQLELAGYDFAKLSNPLSAIHTVLKRLVHKGDIRRSRNAETILYEWDDERSARYNIRDR